VGAGVTLVQLAARLYLGWPYRLRNHLYRTIWERKFRNVQLSKFDSLEDVSAFIKPRLYRPDGWRSLWDAVGYPGKAQRVFEGEAIDAEFDCDDFAIWITAVLTEAQARLGISNVSYTSIFWGKSGHAVCTFMKDGAWHFMDYGLPVGPFSTRSDIAEHVAKTYGKGAKPWFLARHDLSLRLIDFLGL